MFSYGCSLVFPLLQEARLLCQVKIIPHPKVNDDIQVREIKQIQLVFTEKKIIWNLNRKNCRLTFKPSPFLLCFILFHLVMHAENYV